jgi:hypothetical protein
MVVNNKTNIVAQREKKRKKKRRREAKKSTTHENDKMKPRHARDSDFQRSGLLEPHSNDSSVDPCKSGA